MDAYWNNISVKAKKQCHKSSPLSVPFQNKRNQCKNNKTVPILYTLKFLWWFCFHEFRDLGLTKISTLYGAHSYVYKRGQNRKNKTC